MSSPATLAQAFFQQARERPGKPALICDEDMLTYAELAERVRGCASTLSARGVRHGDHVGVVLPNCPAFVVLLLAAADLGLVLVPQPISLSIASLARGFAATGIRHLVATRDMLQEWQGLPPGGVLLAPEDLDAPFTATAVDQPRGGDRDRFILTMTSGSTGDPKPIILTQGTKRGRAEAVAAMYGVTAADITLAATPLYHSLAERLVLLPLTTGGTAVLMTRFSATEWLVAVRRHGVTFTIAVASQLGQIATALADESPPPTLRCVVSSSAALAAEVKQMLQHRLGCDLHECYGTSEIACATTQRCAAGTDGLASVGRAAPGVALCILDEADQLAPPGAMGEILVYTPHLFAGYFGRPDLTAAAMWRGFFRTGDLGRLDGAGFLHYLGRKRDLIITGGINVVPADIEAALAGYPGLLEAAAFAVPDDRLGEVVALAYVAEQPASFDLRELRRHCGRQLADFQQPRKFLALPALPRNAMGKTTRHRLLDLYRAREAA